MFALDVLNMFFLILIYVIYIVLFADLYKDAGID